MARPRLVTDEAILLAARRSALEHGPAVSLDVVAEQLGVTPPALLKRFGSRHALMVAALRPPDEPAWIATLPEIDESAPFEEQLRTVFQRITAFFADEVPCFSALCESGIPIDRIFTGSGPPPPVRGVQALAAWLGRAARRGLVAGDDFETVAAAMIGALQCRIFFQHAFKRSWWRRSERAFVAELAALFARGLAPMAQPLARAASHAGRSRNVAARVAPRRARRASNASNRGRR
jgi:AcrR family transcriptional regulator